jgi:hypothetical protein
MDGFYIFNCQRAIPGEFRAGSDGFALDGIAGTGSLAGVAPRPSLASPAGREAFYCYPIETPSGLGLGGWTECLRAHNVVGIILLLSFLFLVVLSLNLFFSRFSLRSLFFAPPNIRDPFPLS